MTVIAAIGTAAGVVVGCDTASDYRGTSVYRGSKILELTAGNGERVLIGTAGSSSVRPVLQAALRIEDTPAPDCDNAAADLWADAVAAAALGCLVNAEPPVLLPAGEEQAVVPGVMLVAWRRHLWHVTQHDACRPIPAISAIGSGTDVALGAMCAAIAAGVSPARAVEKAVELACKYAHGCGVDERGPVIMTTEGGLS